MQRSMTCATFTLHLARMTFIVSASNFSKTVTRSVVQEECFFLFVYLFIYFFLSIQTAMVWKCLKENWLAPHEWLACNHGGSLRRVCTACNRWKAVRVLSYYVASASSGPFQALYSKRKSSWYLAKLWLAMSESLASQTFSNDRVYRLLGTVSAAKLKVWCTRLKPTGETMILLSWPVRESMIKKWTYSLCCWREWQKEVSSTWHVTLWNLYL